MVSNSQGGITHDAWQRVPNGFEQSIERLSVSGEAGSPLVPSLSCGLNLAECFVSGRIAATQATASVPWSLDEPANRQIQTAGRVFGRKESRPESEPACSRLERCLYRIAEKLDCSF